MYMIWQQLPFNKNAILYNFILWNQYILCILNSFVAELNFKLKYMYEQKYMYMQMM